MTDRAFPDVRKVLRGFFGILMLMMISYVLFSSWDEVKDQFLPAPGVFAVAVFLTVTGLIFAAFGWSFLAGGKQLRYALARAFVASLPAKYLPLGGAIQIGSVVQLSASESSESDSNRKELTVLFLLYSFIQLAGAISVGAFSVFNTDLPGNLRLLAAFGFLALFLAIPGVFDKALKFVPERLFKLSRRRPSLHVGASKALACSIVPIVAAGVSFALFLTGGEISNATFHIASAWAVAWAVGFVSVVFPSGLGPREVALVVLIPDYGAPILVGASLVHRLAMLVAELVLFLLVWRRVFVKSSMERVEK